MVPNQKQNRPRACSLFEMVSRSPPSRISSLWGFEAWGFFGAVGFWGLLGFLDFGEGCFFWFQVYGCLENSEGFNFGAELSILASGFLLGFRVYEGLRFRVLKMNPVVWVFGTWHLNLSHADPCFIKPLNFFWGGA